MVDRNVFSYKAADLLERTVRFSRSVINLCRNIRSDFIGKLVMRQLFNSATSIGANYHEAQGAQSINDFVSKISVAQKEAIETNYWLRLVKEEILANEQVNQLFDESLQLAKMLAAILIKIKNK